MQWQQRGQHTLAQKWHDEAEEMQKHASVLADLLKAQDLRDPAVNE